MLTNSQKSETSSTQKSYEVILGGNLKVTMDKKSRTRVVSFPFEFPDETRGVVIIIRAKDEEWIPMNDIKSFDIKFK